MYMIPLFCIVKKRLFHKGVLFIARVFPVKQSYGFDNMTNWGPFCMPTAIASTMDEPPHHQLHLHRKWLAPALRTLSFARLTTSICLYFHD